MSKILYRCPNTFSPIIITEEISNKRIPLTDDGKPILLDSSNSDLAQRIINQKPRVLRNSGKFRLSLIDLYNRTFAAKSNSNFRMIKDSLSVNSKVLVVGGGVCSIGVSDLRTLANVTSFDIFNSSHVDFVADAHNIPVTDNQFDLVVIQAVLEHVIDPDRCVNEIYRVLKANGRVYSEIPFLQAVHEEAHDYTRYTCSGHRLLFHDFNAISYGVLTGPMESLIWAIAYASKALCNNKLLTLFVRLFLTPLLFLDRLIPNERAKYAPCGTYFYGYKLKSKKSRFDYDHEKVFRSVTDIET